MPRKSPFVVDLTDDERRALASTAAKYSSSYRDVVRAKIVLYAAAGLTNEAIAAGVDLPRQVVAKWRKRFYLSGLAERARRGRPPVFSPQRRRRNQGAGL